MQTLGLSGEAKRSDGWLKSIFWPTVENAWDVDYLGRQGFWICFWIAVFQLVIAAISRNAFLLIVGVVEALVFLIGGMGVRETKWPAAALVFSIFFLNQLANLAGGHFPGVLAVIGAAVLLSNLRATFLASEWRPAAEGEDRPTRFNETLGDKLADQLPAKLWPALQIPFYGLASILLLVSLLGLGVLLLYRFGLGIPAFARPH
jgi:hypothetical protein